jgi:hypothetical protein
MAKTRVSTGQISPFIKFDGTKGIIVPKGSTAQRNSSPESGEIRYNTDLNVMEIYNGSAWGSMGPYPFAFTDYFLGDGITYEFTLSKDVANANDIIVTDNGVQLRAGLDFRIIDGNILSFTEDDSTQNPPLPDSEINVRGYSPITSASIPAGSVTLNELFFSDGTVGQFLTTDGNGNLSFATLPAQDPTVGGDIEGTASNAQIKANTISIRELAVSDGQIGQVLATDGSGNLSFITVSGGVGGGGAATNFFDLTGQIAFSQVPDNFIDIQKLDVLDGTTGQVLSTDGAGNLSFISVVSDLVDDTTPQLGGNLDAQAFNITGTGRIEFGANEENKISFLYANLADLPTASNWHGMFAHVHNENAAYYAHAGNWVKLIDTNKSIDLLADVDTTTSTPTDGQALVWNNVSGAWRPGTVSGASQNLWETFTGDTGSTTANSVTDTFNIVGGTGISTTIAGDTVTINYTGSGGGAPLAFSTIAISGQSNVVADNDGDTLTLIAGTGVTLTTEPTADEITITNSAPNVDQNLFATVTADTGTTTANTTTDTLEIVGGTGISTSISGDTLTVTNDGAINAFTNIAVSGQSDVVADSATDTVTFVAGSNITITTDPATDEITINASAGSGGSGTVTSGTANRLAYYATTGDTIVNTNGNLTWNGTSNTLTTANLEVTGSIGNISTGNITSSGDITASSGTVTADTVNANVLQSTGAGVPTFESANDLVFSAVGEIRFSNNKLREISNPTAETDAANKRYVDETAFTSIQIAADDSTLQTINPGESIKIIGGSNVTTTSDAEGVITINATGTGSTQNLFETFTADTGTTTANSATDTLTVTGGTDISTSITGDILTINFTGSAGATTIGGLTDVNTSGVATGDMLYYNGSSWVPTSGPVTQWTIGANGTSDYTFTGPGFPSGAENDPNLVLYRGHTYRFNNTTGGSHPFLIKTTPGTGTGNQFTDGVSGSSTGVVIFEVPMTPSATTLYYQCQFHAGMVGTITIV